MESHLRPCFVSHTLIYVNQNGALDALRVLNDSPIEKAEPCSSLCLAFFGSLHWVYVSACIAILFLRSMPPHSCRVHQRMHQKALYPDSLKV
jgi:hypothetical protein